MLASPMSLGLASLPLAPQNWMATLSKPVDLDLGRPWYLRVAGPEPLVAIGRVPGTPDPVISVSNLEQVPLEASGTGCLLLPSVIFGRSQLAATLRRLSDEGLPVRVLLAVDPGSGASDADHEIVTPHQLPELLPGGFHVERLELLDYLLVLIVAPDSPSGRMNDREHVDMVAGVQERLLRQRDESFFLLRHRLTRIVTERAADGVTEAPLEAAAIVREVECMARRLEDRAKLEREFEILRTKHDRLRQRRVVRVANLLGRIIRRAHVRKSSA